MEGERVAHKVAEDVQKVDEIVEYARLFAFLDGGSLKYHVVPAETTWLMNVFEGGIRSLSGRARE
jgi:hypothetical protein